MKQSDLKERGGPSPETVIKYEQGKISESVQPRTLEGLDRSLAWKPGSAAAVLEGREPTPLMPEQVKMGGTQRPTVNTWIQVPRCVIQDLSIAVAKLSLHIMTTECSVPKELAEQLTEIQAQTQLLSGLVDSYDRGDTALLLLADSNAPFDLHGLRIKPTRIPSSQESDPES